VPSRDARNDVIYSTFLFTRQVRCQNNKTIKNYKLKNVITLKKIKNKSRAKQKEKSA